MEHSAPDLFRQLFDQHYPSVRRKLIALLRDEAAAEDIAQEVFLKLYRNPPDQLEAAGAWLHRVLTRQAYDYIDKKNRERALLQKSEQQFMVQPQAFQSNEETILERDEQEQVKQLLEALPERDRKLLMLRYSGYSYAEIAEKLRLKQPQVGTLLKRAGERFKRQAMKPDGIMSNE
ncbi:sigma-70 family RNA polymerase sigma factor [Paenibacillus radicis (ex Gao et al. 2016)]|uniref:DNA-directed RNA polymerase sigma-70 factor n=1 Tax=Paenibacillus radicis (ex Gao et al. 2016) TaxID=1737354 RepID=A0A917HKH4_9BACL|nr:sigma-70 family RNA polymerase sigma factor [Paenibacillus radicis (ex Gao et al. 2016)]GGG81580.1 DNA-directed RNA polymerase sigma-70 factor [Paenibacillus radicis (ex Gao et al. 2016)]